MPYALVRTRLKGFPYFVDKTIYFLSLPARAISKTGLKTISKENSLRFPVCGFFLYTLSVSFLHSFLRSWKLIKNQNLEADMSALL